MPQVEADLVIEIGKTQENLKKTIQLQTQIDTNNKKIAANSSASFKKVSADVDNVNKNLEKGAGFLSGLRDNLIKLKERRELAATAEQAKQLTDEIRKTELQIKQMEGTIDTFGKRQKRGLAEVTDSFFSVGQGAIGALNLINLLGDDGSNTTRTIVAATKALVLAESARTVVLGALKAAELSTLAVERVRAFFTAKKTVAAIADSGATAGQIAVSRLYGAATVQATVATKGFTAALLANPITAIAVGLAAVVGLLIAFSGASAKVTKQQIEDFERIRAIQDQITAAKNQTIEAALKLGEAEGRITAAEAERVRENRRFAQDRKNIKLDEKDALLKLQKEFEDGSIKREVDYQLKRSDIIRATNDLVQENKKQHEEAIASIDLQAKKDQQQRDNDLANLRVALIRNELDKVIAQRIQKRDEELQKILPLERDAAEKRKLIEQNAARDIIDIRQKFGRDAVNLLIAQAEAEAALQQKLLDSAASVGTTLEELQSQQNKARVDLQNEFVKLLNQRENEIRDEGKRLGQATETVERNVQEALQKVRGVFSQLFANQEIVFSRQLGEVERQSAEQRLGITRDSLEKRLELFDIAFAREREKLVKAGADATTIESARLKGVNDTIIKFESERLQAQAQIDKNRVDQITGAAGQEVELERQKNIEKLKLDIELAEAQLSLLQLFGDKQDLQVQAQIEAFKTAIANAKRDINNLQGQVTPISWAEIFGVGEAQAADFNAGVESLIVSAQSLISQGIQSRIDEQEKLLEINQTLIDDLNSRIDQEEQALLREEQLMRQGLANNVDAKRKEINDLKAQRDRELQHQKQLLIEKQKLAKQEAIINAAQQGGALITAGATLFKVLSAGGPIGIGVAIGLIATMIDSFLALKAQVASATSGFYEGGYTGDGSARDVAGVTHKKEFVFDHKKTTEYRELFEKIHKDQPLTTKDLLPLLEGTGVVIPEETRKEISRTQTEITERKSKEPNELREIKNQLVEMNETVTAMQERMENSTESWVEPDGTTVLRTWKKGLERIKRIKKNG